MKCTICPSCQKAMYEKLELVIQTKHGEFALLPPANEVAREHVWWGGGGMRAARRPLKGVVRILLECIPVLYCFGAKPDIDERTG